MTIIGGALRPRHTARPVTPQPTHAPKTGYLPGSYGAAPRPARWHRRWSRRSAPAAGSASDRHSSRTPDEPTGAPPAVATDVRSEHLVVLRHVASPQRVNRQVTGKACHLVSWTPSCEGPADEWPGQQRTPKAAYRIQVRAGPNDIEICSAESEAGSWEWRMRL